MSNPYQRTHRKSTCSHAVPLPTFETIAWKIPIARACPLRHVFLYRGSGDPRCDGVALRAVRPCHSFQFCAHILVVNRYLVKKINK